jgi:DNA-binding NarL/FixJ family response regulator
MIRVLVKASSSIAKAGLESLLEAHAGFRLIRDLADGAEAEPPSEMPADVLVVEAETLAALAAREAIDWASFGWPVVLLVRNPAAEQLAEALRAGVKAVLPSALAGPEIVAAIAAAAEGLVVLDVTGAAALLSFSGMVSRRDSETLIEALTPRELEVLRLVTAGLGNKEIASRLAISEHTVKFHVASIMGKLGATSRTEAVTVAIRHGLIMI